MSAGVNETSDDAPGTLEDEEATKSESLGSPTTTGPRTAPRLPQNRGVG